MTTKAAIYMRAYRKQKYQEARQRIVQQLGGRCAHCGTDQALEIDHIDKAGKCFEVSVKCWCMSKERLAVEVAKCQLLCATCHEKKSIKDLGNSPARGTHGTLSAARYCSCEACKTAKRDYMQAYRSKRRIAQGRPDVRCPRTGLVHGTKHGYSYYACRCAPCTSAHAHAQRVYYAALAKRTTAPHS